jgi:hypothetical protein
MKKPRGSELLATKWSESDLAKLAELEHEGITLVRFFPKGIPGPDGAWGSWLVAPAQLSKFIDHLVRYPKVLSSIIIFPNGVPAVESFEVEFTAGSARER